MSRSVVHHVGSVLVFFIIDEKLTSAWSSVFRREKRSFVWHGGRHIPDDSDKDILQRQNFVKLMSGPSTGLQYLDYLQTRDSNGLAMEGYRTFDLCTYFFYESRIWCLQEFFSGQEVWCVSQALSRQRYSVRPTTDPSRLSALTTTFFTMIEEWCPVTSVIVKRSD